MVILRCCRGIVALLIRDSWVRIKVANRSIDFVVAQFFDIPIRLGVCQHKMFLLVHWAVHLLPTGEKQTLIKSSRGANGFRLVSANSIAGMYPHFSALPGLPFARRATCFKTRFVNTPWQRNLTPF